MTLQAPLLNPSIVYDYKTSSSEAIDGPSKSFGGYAAKSWLLHSEVAEEKGIPQGDLLNFLQWPSNEILRRCKYVCDDGYYYYLFNGGRNLLHIASRYRLRSILLAILKNL